jgi:hypothetical protein
VANNPKASEIQSLTQQTLHWLSGSNFEEKKKLLADLLGQEFLPERDTAGEKHVFEHVPPLILIPDTPGLDIRINPPTPPLHAEEQDLPPQQPPTLTAPPKTRTTQQAPGLVSFSSYCLENFDDSGHV